MNAGGDKGKALQQPFDVRIVGRLARKPEPPAIFGCFSANSAASLRKYASSHCNKHAVRQTFRGEETVIPWVDGSTPR